MNSVYKFINDLGIDNKYVVVAVSGGPDSMFLIDILLKLKEKLNLKIVVAHVHHNLRKESDDEAIKVEEYCKENSLIFEMKKLDKYPNDKFSEEAARKLRYEFFDELMKKYNADTLFTAHHGDDLVETVLMRLTRGSSLKGYAGINAISNDRGYKIARPLLFLTKTQIQDYLDKNNIYYSLDMSNKNDKYTRNRYRKYILPELKKENENVHEKFLDFSNKLLLADEFITKHTDKIYNDIIIDNEIDLLEFKDLDQIIKIYILEMYLKKIYESNIDLVTSKHIDIILNLINKKGNSIIDLPDNKKGILEYNKFKVVNNINNSDYEFTFENQINLKDNHKIYIDNSTKLTTNFVIHLNSKDVVLPFHVRNKRPGDKMKVKNMQGTKKVSDIFTDFKLSKEFRDSYPIVTDDTGEIIWIPGIKKSHLDRKKEQNYDIILKYD